MVVSKFLLLKDCVDMGSIILQWKKMTEFDRKSVTLVLLAPTQLLNMYMEDEESPTKSSYS